MNKDCLENKVRNAEKWIKENLALRGITLPCREIVFEQNKENGSLPTIRLDIWASSDSDAEFNDKLFSVYPEVNLAIVHNYRENDGYPQKSRCQRKQFDRFISDCSVLIRDLQYELYTNRQVAEDCLTTLLKEKSGI